MIFAFLGITFLLSHGHLAVAQCRDGTILRRLLSDEQKKSVLDKHNFHRDNVAGGKVSGQPPAQDMIELEWDDEVAEKAQSWADECEFEHDSSANRRLADGSDAGQNLAMKMIYGKTADHCKPDTPAGLVDLWFNEVKKYHYTSDIVPGAGHYTQLCWAKTTKVGCGYSVYLKGRMVHCFLVCNYAPPGNYVGEYLYEKGQKNCKAFNLKDSNKYRNLCVPK